ncbi:hypothetical protein, partial [Gluconobacter japonicus]|uniref:hypothetical protein n=1 Tax=Gluconobacter japonicus TaxID=376620 RepID=UPI0039E87DFC
SMAAGRPGEGVTWRTNGGGSTTGGGGAGGTPGTLAFAGADAFTEEAEAVAADGLDVWGATVA